MVEKDPGIKKAGVNGNHRWCQDTNSMTWPNYFWIPQFPSVQERATTVIATNMSLMVVPIGNFAMKSSALFFTVTATFRNSEEVVG